MQSFYLESITASDDCVVLRMDGDIDAYAAPQVRDRVTGLAGNGTGSCRSCGSPGSATRSGCTLACRTRSEPTGTGRRQSQAKAAVPGNGAVNTDCCEPGFKVTKELLPRTNQVGAPWLSRSVTSGRARQIARIRSARLAAESVTRLILPPALPVTCDP